MSKYCVPAWSREGLPCPHGEKVLLPLSTFTMPSSSTGLDWLAAAFCTLPFDWVLVVLLRGWLVRGLWELALGLLILVAYIVLVALQSGLLHEPRPAASCLCSCGMPSGHAAPRPGLWDTPLLDLRRSSHPGSGLRDSGFFAFACGWRKDSSIFDPEMTTIGLLVLEGSPRRQGSQSPSGNLASTTPKALRVRPDHSPGLEGCHARFGAFQAVTGFTRRYARFVGFGVAREVA
ncbi:unnamed protein product [Symbiodinium microadriaticum]|nr:unnamed protein product [Symbiodinium microadriaticum]